MIGKENNIRISTIKGIIETYQEIIIENTAEIDDIQKAEEFAMKKIKPEQIHAEVQDIEQYKVIISILTKRRVSLQVKNNEMQKRITEHKAEIKLLKEIKTNEREKTDEKEKTYPHCFAMGPATI